MEIFNQQKVNKNKTQISKRFSYAYDNEYLITKKPLWEIYRENLKRITKKQQFKSVICMDYYGIHFQIHPLKDSSILKIQQLQKLQFSVHLSFSDQAQKYQPVIIFKGKQDGLLYKNEFEKHNQNTDRKSLIFTQPQLQMDENIFKKWVQYTFQKQSSDKFLIIIDENIKKYLSAKIKYVQFSLVPHICQQILSPQQILINELFEQYFYTNLRSINFQSNISDIKQIRYQLISSIEKAWINVDESSILQSWNSAFSDQDKQIN